jgi:ubiquinone/menaquinone biosynthesis C-methylase UbiE
MQEIIRYYEQTREDKRLAQGWGLLELARTQELILRHLPKPPQVVLDVGGAAGIYSAWLGSLGYETHLIDPVASHVEQARAHSTIRSASTGDARKLVHADDSVDAVLLLGPLYHLTERSDRLAALREARRVLRLGGLLFAAAISRYASLLHSLFQGFVDEPRFTPILDRDLRDGQHRNPTDDLNFFTTAFFHKPDELTREIEEAGFAPIDLVGVEGPAWLAPVFDARWADPARRQRMLELVRSVEHESALLGVSQHLLLIAR